MSSADTSPSPAQPDMPRPAAPPPANPAPRRSRGTLGIIVVLIVSLLGSAFFQQLAVENRAQALNRQRGEGGSSSAAARIGSLDSFSLVLLLGGLRGPLVMYLWTASESQKVERELESFDTRVEMIRLLQSEFDSVLLFQMWNKAYNISVQMASLSNKYATILDALEYGRRADKASPSNINILGEIGRLFSDKLGNSTEKEYYRRRVRTETLPVYVVRFKTADRPAIIKALTAAGIDAARVRITDESAAGTSRLILEKFAGDRVKDALGLKDDATANALATFTPQPRQAVRAESAGRRTELDTMLDVNGYILPELLKAARTVPPGQEGNNGAELQYLEPFQPFPYGLSPAALGYNYVKRAQVLQTVGKQRHIQWSEIVTDNQPGMTLRLWAEEERDRGRVLELRGLALPADTKTLPREIQAATAAPDSTVTDRRSLREAADSYRRATQVAQAAIPEFERHLRNYPQTIQGFRSQTDSLRALAHLAQADGLYLQAILDHAANASTAQHAQTLANARAQYHEAELAFRRIVLMYYTAAEDLAAAGTRRTDVEQKNLSDLRQIMARLDAHLAKAYPNLQATPFATDREEYDLNLRRITARLAKIK